MQPSKVVITGAAGRIGSQIAFLLAQGLLFSSPIRLFLLEKSNHLVTCADLKENLATSAFPLLASIDATDNLEIAFKNAHYIFFCGATHCTNPTDWLSIQQKNWKAFVEQGRSLNHVASSEALSIVIANPCNTNALILIKSAPNIPKRNFHALMRLDYNRIYHKLRKKIVIWGNHSSTVVPDTSIEWITFTQKRGEIITAANGRPASASTAYAAIEAMKDLINPTQKSTFFPSAMYTGKNPFGLNEDLVFGLPCCTIQKGEYEIAEGFAPSPELYSLIRKSEAELIEERAKIQKLVDSL